MNIDVSGTVIVDCSDIEDVAVNLIDSALNFLAENIERNDKVYAQNIQQAITAVMEKVNSVLKNVQSVLRDDDESDTDSRKFDDLFAKLWRVLSRNIQNFVGRNSDLRRDKDSDCEEFKTVIERILDEEFAKGYEELHITEGEIDDLEAELGGINSAYESCLHQLRTGLSERMETDLDKTLDLVLTKMKDNLCGILGGSETGSC